MSSGLAGQGWRTIIGGGGSAQPSATSWQPIVGVGILLTATVSGTLAKPQVSTGFVLSPTNPRGVIDQKPAIAISQAPTSGDVVKPQVSPGLALSPVLRDFKPPQTPAVEIVQIKYDLTHRSGANSAVNGASSPSVWTNSSNATGIHNGSNATHTGSATAAHDCLLNLDYADFTNKDSLTILSVKLHFYVSQSGTVLNNGGLQLWRGDAGGYQAAVLEFITNDVDYLTTPRTFDVTANYTTWASLSALRAQVRHVTGLAVLVTAQVDAVELEITATTTQVV